MTPGKFDNTCYSNLKKKGLGLLASDQALESGMMTREWVHLYAASETAFFRDFADVLERASVHKVKTGNEGDVRHRCDAFNTVLTDPGQIQSPKSRLVTRNGVGLHDPVETRI